MNHQNLSYSQQLIQYIEAQFQIQSHAYATAHLLRLKSNKFDESAISYLINHQYQDGSLGSEFFHVADRIICTLAAYNTFNRFIDGNYSDFINNAEEFIQHNLPKVIGQDLPFVGYSLLLYTELYLYFDGKFPLFLHKFTSKIESIIEEISSNQIFNTYYEFSLEIFDDSVLKTLDPDQFIRENGSVASSIPSSVKVYNLLTDNNSKLRMENFFSSMINKDGGIGNFHADNLSILFSLIPLIFIDTENEIHELVKSQLGYVSQSLKSEGIPLDYNFPQGDLDDTLTFIILANKYRFPLPERISVILEKYQLQKYRTYLSQGNPTSRHGKEYIETEVLAKLVLAKNILCVNSESIQNNLLKSLEDHSLNTRWHILEEYQLPYLLLAVDDSLVGMQIEKKIQSIVKDRIMKFDPSNPYALIFLIIASVYGFKLLNWQFSENHHSKLVKIIKKIHELELSEIPPLWVAKSLYKIPKMDGLWLTVSQMLGHDYLFATSP